MMNNAFIYIHGKGGSAAESRHYEPLFPGRTVFGLDYKGTTPWEADKEIYDAVCRLRQDHENIVLIANSIGAYFSMNAGIGPMIRKAYFVSPVTDMEKLITGMMGLAGVTEDELKSRGVILTPSGEELSWEYLRYVRAHPIKWDVPTSILYGSKDELIPFETVRDFAEEHGAGLTVMEGGEHWFHTDSQMRFLDSWILRENAERNDI